MYDLPLTLVRSLACTLAFELAYARIFGVKSTKDLLLVLLVNVLTNPPVVLLYMISALYTPWGRTPVVAILEVSAIIVEAALYHRFASGIARPACFSIAVNAFSYAMGIIVNTLL